MIPSVNEIKRSLFKQEMDQEQQIVQVQLKGTLLDLLRQFENLDSDGLDTAVFRLEQLASLVLRLCDVNLVDDDIHRLITDTISKLRRVDKINTNTPFVTETVYSGRPGRPALEISYDHLVYLLNFEFSVPDIAQALGVSERTIFRRMKTYGLSARQNVALSDQELEDKVRQVLREFPNAGYRRVISQLSVNGLRPAQLRVREAMQRVDPQGVAMRWLRLTPRRQYNVSGPLALWHIDGNHKLIR